jgi:hypothetical protein
VDEGSDFKGVLTDAIAEMSIPVNTVVPEEHQGILCERLNGFLDKVERMYPRHPVHTLRGFLRASSYSSVAWNSAPVAGDNMQQSFAAKARTFNLP